MKSSQGFCEVAFIRLLKHLFGDENELNGKWAGEK